MSASEEETRNSQMNNKESSSRSLPTPPNIDSIIVLDGGMGHELKRTGGVKISGEIGSLPRFLGVAMANIQQPEIVINAHLAFMDAGCDIITTNSYSVVPRVFELCSQRQDKEDGEMTLESLLIAACENACSARDRRPGKRVLVAGSLPPLAESYRPDCVGPYEQNLSSYRRIIKAIAPYCDILLCETMSTIAEAKAACVAASEMNHKLPVWVSFTLDESKPVLRSGETLHEAVKALADIGDDCIQAYLVNCTSPESVTLAIPILTSLLKDKRQAAGNGSSSIMIGGYANGFATSTDAKDEYRDISETEYYDFVSRWIDSGATVVGGCCGIFPPHIAYIRKRLDETSNNT